MPALRTNAYPEAAQAAYRALTTACASPSAEGDLHPSGSVRKERRANQEFWYHQRHVPAADGREAHPEKRYIGKAGEAEVEARIGQFNRAKKAYDTRKRLVAQLKRAGYPVPTPPKGEVARALAAGGIFRAGAVALGTIADKAHQALLGFRLPESVPDGTIILAADREPPGLARILAAWDSGILPEDAGTGRVRYRCTDGFAVEVVTPAADAMVPFLLRRPADAAMLDRDGVHVRVPSPERMALARIAGVGIDPTEPGIARAAVAVAIIEAGGRMGALAEAWAEARAEGADWRRDLRRGTAHLPRRQQEAIAAHVPQG